MEKLDSKNLKLLYHDKVIRFYQVGKTSTDKKPIIFINGQMEHRIQAIETATELTKSICYQYNIHNYDSTIHTPYIMVYDYPIFNKNKGSYNTQLFANSLTQALAENKLENIDIMGISFGGMIGMRCSKNERINQVRAIHPPLQGSPLANLHLIKSKLGDLRNRQKLIYAVLKMVVNSQFGFQKENANGGLQVTDKYDLDKIVICSSHINNANNIDALSKELAKMIYTITKKTSDGVVCFDYDELKKNGYNVLLDENPTPHFCVANSDYLETVYKTLKRK